MRWIKVVDTTMEKGVNEDSDEQNGIVVCIAS
jgi:hypothetical protein